MNESKTPQWLIDTQNKSWEPEILISGITLTILFILSSYIYNLYAMLVQDFAVYDRMAISLYVLSTILLTGFKIILIVHLILRGVWTGFVGLSYVFPEGVKKEKLLKSKKDINFDKPEVLVIKIEKICSLLFSFIFSTITLFIGLYLIYIPVVLLFIIGLDLLLIRYFLLSFFPLILLLIAIFAVLIDRHPKFAGLKQKVENSFLNCLLPIYATNIGRIKTGLIFVFYFIIIVSLSLPEITKFEFENDESTEVILEAGNVSLNNDLYVDLRDQDLRIPKATISQFHVTGNTIELFISHYKADLYTIKEINKDPGLLDEYDTFSGSNINNVQDLYKITIDDEISSGLRWYNKKINETDQKGMMTTISLVDIESGYHELKIDKILWSVKKDSLLHISDWIAITFEKDK